MRHYAPRTPIELTPRRALLFGFAFFAVGVAVAPPGFVNAWRAFHQPFDLRESTCVLLDKRVTEGMGSHTKFVRHGKDIQYEAWVRISYDDHGISRTAEGDLFLGPVNTQAYHYEPMDALRRWRMGARYPLWMDDRHPGAIYLSPPEKGSQWTSLIMPCCGILFALGGLGIAMDAFIRPKSTPRDEVAKRETHDA